MLRNALPFEVTKVSEWKQFYYNYEILSDLVRVLENLSLIRDHLRTLVMSNTPLGNRITQIELRKHMLIKVMQFMHEVNERFFRFRDHQMDLVFLFSQMKSQELYRKSKFFIQITSKCEKEMDDCLILLQNTYIENEFLHRLVEFSLEKEQMIIKLHQNITKRYEDLDTPPIDYRKINRIYKKIRFVSEGMKKMYIQKRAIKDQDAKNQIKGSVRKVHTEDFSEMLLSGVLKFSIGLMIFSMIIFAYLLREFDITIENNQEFRNLFPLWRGLSYFIVYNWVLAFDILIFEKHHINYRKILNLERNRMPKSETLLFSASIFTTIYFSLFIMCLLGIEGYEIFEKFGVDMFPAVGWMGFIGFMLFPFGEKGSNGLAPNHYFLVILGWMFFSPIIGVNYTSNWLSEQLSSFKQPFHDVSYTFIFYLGSDRVFLEENWEEARFIGALIGTYIYLLRIAQGIRKGISAGKYFVGAPNFKGCLKCVFNIMTIWTAYIYRVHDEDISYLVYWIIAATISTGYAYVYDLVLDWNFLKRPCCCGSGPLFRVKRVLGDGNFRLYILFAVLNFILRIAWVFTISTDLVVSLFHYPHIFIMIVSILEIFRRGVWNLLFIEKEHVANCENFDCTVNYASIEGNVIKQYCSVAGTKEEKETRVKFTEAYTKNKEESSKLDLQLKGIREMNAKTTKYNEDISQYVEKAHNKIKEMRSQLGISLKQ